MCNYFHVYLYTSGEGQIVGGVYIYIYKMEICYEYIREIYIYV
jgi:hypothetical protein